MGDLISSPTTEVICGDVTRPVTVRAHPNIGARPYISKTPGSEIVSVAKPRVQRKYPMDILYRKVPKLTLYDPVGTLTPPSRIRAALPTVGFWG